MFLIVYLNEMMGKTAFYSYLGYCIDHLWLMPILSNLYMSGVY